MGQEDDSMKGYVYILRNPAFPGLVKVGKTTKDPAARARELSSGSGVPAPYAVAWTALVTNCHQVERLIHQQLAHARARNDREFFAIPLKEAISIASRIAGRSSIPWKVPSSKSCLGFLGVAVLVVIVLWFMFGGLPSGVVPLNQPKEKQATPNHEEPAPGSSAAAKQEPIGVDFQTLAARIQLERAALKAMEEDLKTTKNKLNGYMQAAKDLELAIKLDEANLAKRAPVSQADCPARIIEYNRIVEEHNRLLDDFEKKEAAYKKRVEELKRYK